MATRLPIVQASGELQQLQSGDPASPAATAVLRVIDTSCALPSNSTLSTLDSLTINTGITFTIPTSSAVLISDGDSQYWQSLTSVTTINFSQVWKTASAYVTIPGMSFTAAVNSLYEFEVVLRAQCTDANGANFKFVFSGAGALGTVYALSADNTTLTTGSNQVNNAFSQTFLAVSGVDMMWSAKGILITVGNTGNLTLQIQKLTAGTVTVYVGSTMKVRKLA